MEVFINPKKLFVMKTDKKGFFILIRDFRVVIDGERLVVTKGFVTDFASVPKAFHWLVPPRGRYSAAAVVHDFLYTRGKGTRKHADEVFNALMKVLNVKWWRRKSMYRAVRLFGWKYWNKFKESK